MEYNKKFFVKANDKRVLHKVKKQWVVVSMALLMALGGSAALTQVSAHADSNDSNQPTLKDRINENLKNVQSQTQPKAPAQPAKADQPQTKQIDQSAKIMHNRLILNAGRNPQVQADNGSQTTKDSSNESQQGRTLGSEDKGLKANATQNDNNSNRNDTEGHASHRLGLTMNLTDKPANGYTYSNQNLFNDKPSGYNTSNKSAANPNASNSTWYKDNDGKSDSLVFSGGQFNKSMVSPDPFNTTSDRNRPFNLVFDKKNQTTLNYSDSSDADSMQDSFSEAYEWGQNSDSDPNLSNMKSVNLAGLRFGGKDGSMAEMFNTDPNLEYIYNFNDLVNRGANGKAITSFNSTFANDPNLKYVGGFSDAKHSLNATSVSDMSYMFGGDVAMPYIDLRGMNTSNKLKEVSSMFQSDTHAKQIFVGGLNTTNVSDSMNDMFYNDNRLTSLDLSSVKVNGHEPAAPNFKVSDVKDMSNMFQNDSHLTDLNLNGFVPASANDMNNMFYNDHALQTLHLNGFKTSSDLTTMEYTFASDYALKDLDLQGLHTNNVSDMTGTFENDQALRSINLAGWNTHRVGGLNSDYEQQSGSMANMFESDTNLKRIKLSANTDFNRTGANYNNGNWGPLFQSSAQIYDYEGNPIPDSTILSISSAIFNDANGISNGTAGEQIPASPNYYNSDLSSGGYQNPDGHYYEYFISEQPEIYWAPNNDDNSYDSPIDSGDIAKDSVIVYGDSQNLGYVNAHEFNDAENLDGTASDQFVPYQGQAHNTVPVSDVTPYLPNGYVDAPGQSSFTPTSDGYIIDKLNGKPENVNVFYYTGSFNPIASDNTINGTVHKPVVGKTVKLPYPNLSGYSLLNPYQNMKVRITSGLNGDMDMLRHPDNGYLKEYSDINDDTAAPFRIPVIPNLDTIPIQFYQKNNHPLNIDPSPDFQEASDTGSIRNLYSQIKSTINRIHYRLDVNNKDLPKVVNQLENYKVGTKLNLDGITGGTIDPHRIDISNHKGSVNPIRIPITNDINVEISYIDSADGKLLPSVDDNDESLPNGAQFTSNNAMISDLDRFTGYNYQFAPNKNYPFATQVVSDKGNLTDNITVPVQAVTTVGQWDGPHSAYYKLDGDGTLTFSDEPFRTTLSGQLFKGEKDNGRWKNMISPSWPSDTFPQDGNSNLPNALNRNSVRHIKFNTPIYLPSDGNSDTAGDGEDLSDKTGFAVFSRLKNLQSFDANNLKIPSNVHSLSGMFLSDKNLQSVDLSSLDVSGISDMSNMFWSDSKLNYVNVNNWKTSNLSDISGMFGYDTQLPGDIVQPVSDKKGGFIKDKKNEQNYLPGLSDLDTHNVVDMSAAFEGDSNLKGLDLSNWTSSDVSDMSAMFSGDTHLKYLNIKGLNTTGMIDDGMSNMFKSDFRDPINDKFDWIVMNQKMHLDKGSGLNGYWMSPDSEYISSPTWFSPRELDLMGTNFGPGHYNITNDTNDGRATDWIKQANDPKDLQTNTVQVFNQDNNKVQTDTIYIPLLSRGSTITPLDQLNDIPGDIPKGYQLPVNRPLFDKMPNVGVPTFRKISDSNLSQPSDYKNYASDKGTIYAYVRGIPVNNPSDKPGVKPANNTEVIVRSGENGFKVVPVAVSGYYGDQSDLVLLKNIQGQFKLPDGLKYIPYNSDSDHLRSSINIDSYNVMHYSIDNHNPKTLNNKNWQNLIQDPTWKPGEPMLYYADNHATLTIRFIDQTNNVVGSHTFRTAVGADFPLPTNSSDASKDGLMKGYTLDSDQISHYVVPSSNNEVDLRVTGYRPASLNVIYINQHGRQVGRSDEISGYAGDTVNVTNDQRIYNNENNKKNNDQAYINVDGSKVPNGYTLDQNQDSDYTLDAGHQTVYLHVTGKPVSSSLPIRILEKQGNEITHVSDKSANFNNVQVGDVETLNPKDYEPKNGYKVDNTDSVQSVRVNSDGTLTPNSVTFTYDSTNTGVDNHITVRYFDQKTHQLLGSAKTIPSRSEGTSIDVTKPSQGGEAVPNGYHLSANENPTVKFGDLPQNVNLNVTGNPVNDTLKIHRIYKSYTQPTYSDTSDVKIKGRVGDVINIDPNKYNPNSAYYPVGQDSVVPVQINNDGSLSTNNITFTYMAYMNPKTANTYGKIRVHYLDATIPNVAANSVGNVDKYGVPTTPHEEIDEETDCGNANSNFDISPYIDNIPDFGTHSYRYVSVIGHKPPTQYPNGTEDVYIKVLPNN